MAIDEAPSSRADVKAYVRGLTDYSDTPDELPETALDTLVDLAKLKIANKVDGADFYVDSGLGQALVGTTAILAKERVENYSISSWSVGDQSVTVDSTSNDSQLESWNDLVLEGMAASSATPSDGDGLRNTTEFMQ